MKLTKKQYLTWILLALIAIPIYAQPQFQAGGNFTLGFPQNEFGDNVDNTGYGGSGFFGYQLPRYPMLVGASFSFLIYGYESRKEPFSQTIPDVTVDVKTTNSIVQGHLFLRIQPEGGFIRPYIDGLFGFNYLSTTTSIESENWTNDDDIASSTNYDDIALSMGGGGGLMLRIYDGSQKRNSENKLYAVHIDMGLRYLKGGEAEYLKKGAIFKEENGKVSYDVNKSTTDLQTWHIGVSFEF